MPNAEMGHDPHGDGVKADGDSRMLYPTDGDEMPRIARASHQPLFAYGVAVATVLAAAVATRLIFAPWFEDHSQYLLFTVAILASAIWGGRGAAICAAILSILASAWSDRATADVNYVEFGAFVLTAAGVILLIFDTEKLRRHSGASETEAEQRARDARHLADELNLLIDGAQDYAIYMLDPDGRVTIWNSGAERLKGWTEQEIVGKPSALFYPADAVAAGKPTLDLQRAKALGKLEQEEWRQRKDGSEFLAHISITALRDDDGDLRGFGKVVRDVTDQRAAERSVQAGANHLKSILSTVPDAMIVIDERGTIVSFSAAAERMFGYAEGDVVGANVNMLMPSSDRERHDDYMARYMETGDRHIIGIGRVVVARRSDGSSFPIELSIGEAIGEEQRVFTGFIRDLTEREQTAQRLEQLQSELIHVARVSAMGTMASTLAHELNQPLTAIANYMEGVRDLLIEPDPADLPMIRDALNDAASEAMRAGYIVRRLRDFVARGEVEKTLEDLPALISEAAVLGLMGAREKGVATRFELDPAATPVIVDKVQIQQVLINLIRNAVEAMASSPQKLLAVSTHDDATGFVRVSVADTGPGVSPALADSLFTAFASSKDEGMGLGLSICRTIVEANGGRIWMDPRQGGGSIFTFTLAKADPEKD